MFGNRGWWSWGKMRLGFHAMAQASGCNIGAAMRACLRLSCDATRVGPVASASFAFAQVCSASGVAQHARSRCAGRDAEAALRPIAEQLLIRVWGALMSLGLAISGLLESAARPVESLRRLVGTEYGIAQVAVAVVRGLSCGPPKLCWFRHRACGFGGWSSLCALGDHFGCSPFAVIRAQAVGAGKSALRHADPPYGRGAGLGDACPLRVLALRRRPAVGPRLRPRHLAAAGRGGDRG